MSATNFTHPLVGRAVVYRDPYKDKAEQGTITSVNVGAGLVFVRYGLGSTSAATKVDDRLTDLQGRPVSLEAPMFGDVPLDSGVRRER